MSLLQRVLYGLISGFSELLPVSSQAHQAIMLRLFGADGREPLMDLLVHLAVLLALFTGCRAMISRIQRERSLESHSRRGRRVRSSGTYELRLLRSAALPLMLVLLIYISARRMESSMTALALLLVINGVLLIIPEHSRQANKDARLMSGLDAIAMGILGGLSALPGISRIGMISTYGLLRGADKQYVLNWALLLSIPALALMCILDLVFVFVSGIGPITFLVILGYFLAGVAAYLGAYLSVIFIRFLTVRSGYSAFAYYSWGAALFAMILYLIV